MIVLHRSPAQVLGQKRGLRFHFNHLLFSHWLVEGAVFFLQEAQQFSNPQLIDVLGISKRGSCESVNSRRFFWRRQLKVQVRRRCECWAQAEVRFSHLIFKQCYGAGGIPNSHPLPLPPEIKFLQLVKFLSQDLNLVLVEFLKGS